MPRIYLPRTYKQSPTFWSEFAAPKNPISKRIGFYVELPKPIAREIRRRVKSTGMPQWQVITDAINRTNGDSVAQLPKK